ncbi:MULTISPECIES: hypothetical protein [unclassified Mesorhizobium]|uniref:hypothetical protein n=2 Tax=unclassified Mesorhizobium TaxID=325217 RepID=UPI00333C2D92
MTRLRRRPGSAPRHEWKFRAPFHESGALGALLKILLIMNEPASSNRWMKPFVGRCYFDASRDLPDKSWLQRQNMSKTTLIAIAILAISVGCAEAKDRKVETAPLGTYANSKNLPVCTAASSLFEVLGDKCFLVRGSDDLWRHR